MGKESGGMLGRMAPELPALKPDLVFQSEESRAGGEVVVGEPSSGRYFKLSLLAVRAAELLDGERTAEEVAAELEKRWREQVPPEGIRELVEQLGSMGLLVGSDPPTAREPRRSLLAWRIHLVDPGPLLAWLARRLRFAFSRAFVVLGVAVMVAAAAVLTWKLPGWSVTFQRDLGWSSLATVYLPALAVMVLHELAHGVTCAHYGCRVRSMGVILYYFQPCTYCEVSDSWLLPRGQRIAVMLAGVFFEGLLWSAAVFVRLAVPASSLAAEVAMGLVVSSGIKCLFNLNPLIKLDGYYVLSDLLGLPNLRARSFACLADVVRGRRPDLSGRHLAACLLFAPLALVYSAGLILWFAVWLYGFLDERLGEWGLAVFGGIVVLTLVFIWGPRSSSRPPPSRDG